MAKSIMLMQKNNQLLESFPLSSESVFEKNTF
jgi:hypothetical protein